MGRWRGSRSIAASRKRYWIQGEGNGGREGKEEGAEGKWYHVEMGDYHYLVGNQCELCIVSLVTHLPRGAANGVVRPVVEYKELLDYC